MPEMRNQSSIMKSITDSVSKWLRCLCLGAIACLFATTAFGAGLTIVTHGFKNGVASQGEPEWVRSMANEISRRTGTAATAVTIYRMTIEVVDLDGTPRMTSFAKIAGPDGPAGPDPRESASGEVVIVLDWGHVAGWIPIRGSRTVAQLATAPLFEANAVAGLGGPLAELPVHLIGHSRGASVVTEIARVLGEAGVWVDQLTTLDPHQVNADAPISVWSNVAFADNYWRSDGTIGDALDGDFLAGAYDGDLNSVISSGSEHPGVHAYYHGTIRIDAGSDILAGGGGLFEVTQILGSWYPGTAALPSRDRTGFYYSRLGTGARPTSGIGTFFGGAATRVAVTKTAPTWPNISAPRIPRTGAITIGETVLVESTYQSDYTQNTTTYFLDTDRNPYNGTSRTIRTGNPGTTFTTTGNDSFNWDTSGLVSDTYYLGSKIVANGKTRYYYAKDPVVLNPANEQVGTALTLASTVWDDPRTGGDGDGRIEGGETVKLNALLSSSAAINQVTATLYSGVPGILITDNEIDFSSFVPGQSQSGQDSFDLTLNLTSNTGALLVMDVRYYQGGLPYRQTFQITKDILAPGDAAFAVQSIRVDDNTTRYGGNNNDGVIQSGESVRIYPRLVNNGVATATRVDVWLEHVNPSTLLEIPDAGQQNAERYPDLPSGASAEPNNNSDFAVYLPDKSFSGTLFADVLVKWDQAASPVRLQNGLSIVVAPTPWLSFGPKTHSFGVAKPGTNLSYVLNLANPGSAPLQVTGLAPSDPDTTVSGVSLPLTLNPGQAQAVTVTFNTTGLQGQVSRTVTVASNGRVSNPGLDNVLTLTGLVSDSVPVFQLPTTNIVFDSNSVDIWGPWIVWEDNARGVTDIRAFNTVTLSNLLVTTNSADHLRPRIHNNIIAWDDRRNGSTIDIYGFDLATGREFLVSADPAAERLIGVDNGKIAYVRSDFAFTSFGQQIPGYNIYVFDVQNSTTTKLTDYAVPAAGSPVFTSTDSPDRMDFSDGLIVWREGRRNWISAQSGWDSAESGTIAKFKLGTDTAKVIVPGTIDRGPKTAGGRIVWAKADENSNDQLWVLESGTSRQLTSQSQDLAEQVLAVGANHVVYDKNGSPGLFYYDLITNAEKLLTNEPVGVEDGRMDGKTVVWLALSPVRVLYAFIDQPDVSVTDSEIVLSKAFTVDTDVLGVTATVRNSTDFDSTGNLVVRLFRDDPDSGGTQIGTDQTLVGGIGARGSGSVVFTGIPAGPEGTNTLFVKLFPAGVDNGANNKASISLIVLDSDISGPSVTNFLVAELNGDGDGTIGSDEQFRVSWQLSDASGIGSVQLLIDGVLTVHTQTSGTNTATVGPLAAGPHQVEIRATDADTSPASSTNVFAVNVARAENIAVSYGGLRLTNSGSAVNLGAFTAGASEPRLFSVQNLGEQSLFISALSTTGAIASASLSSSNVIAGGLTALTITPSAQTVGAFTAQVSIATSDPLNPSFRLPVTWQVQGQAPGILSQPGNVTTTLGGTALFSVSTTGTEPLSYQWRKNDVSLLNDGRVTGATTATLSITNVQATDSAAYYAVVVNPFGATNSSTAMLTIDSASATITGQPTRQVVSVGEAASFTVTATGVPAPSYQWRKNGNAITGATNAIYAIASATTSDTGYYSVIVANASGSVTSTNATLAVNVTETTGGTVSFSTYNFDTNRGRFFRPDGSPLGANYLAQAYAGFTPGQLAPIGAPQPFFAESGYVFQSAEVRIPTLPGGSPAYFQIRAWDAGTGATTYESAMLAGFVTMQSAVFTATPGSGPPGGPGPPLNDFPNVVWTPVITQPPQSQVVVVGQPATFSVSISSVFLGVGFQWRKDQIPIPNATASPFIIPSAQLSDAGAYDVVVTNAFGSVTSAPPALLLVGLPPMITSQPQSQTVGVGSNVTVGVAVSGTWSISAQWRKNDANIVGGSTNGLVLPNIQPADAGNYRVIFTNLWGSTTSAVATISVDGPPYIPNPQITPVPRLALGTTITLTSQSTGVSLTYQWRLNGTNILGATGQALTITNASPGDAGTYSVLVSNLAGGGEEVILPPVQFMGGLQMYAGFLITGNVGDQILVKYANVVGGVTNWLVLTNFVHPGGEHLFIDRTSPGRDKRFYQVEQPVN